MLRTLGAVAVAALVFTARGAARTPWHELVSLAIVALALLVGGAQALYFGVTGRRRGPVHRSFSAFLDAWVRGGG